MPKKMSPLLVPQTRSEKPLAPARSLIELTYQRLRTDIVQGRLGAGEKLRVEHLKDHYQVSAGTLREAITRLVSDALVVAQDQKGFTVAPLSLSDLEDLTRLRLHIEIDALRQSIRQGDEAWRSQVRAVFEQLSAFEQPIKMEQRERWEILNAQFHHALIAAAASPWTLKILAMLAQHGERYRYFSMNLVNSNRDVHAEHQQIFELAMKGQDSRAALALEAHIVTTLELLRAGALKN